MGRFLCFVPTRQCLPARLGEQGERFESSEFGRFVSLAPDEVHELTDHAKRVNWPI